VAIILDATFNVWRRHWGDPDPLGWLTTVAYLVAAALCTRTAMAARRAGADSRTDIGADQASPERPGPWWLFAVGLLGLGLNKQLHLQILVREAGLAFVGFIGLEKHRRWVGRAFVIVLALFLLRVLATAARHMLRSTRGHRLLFIGLALLACFAVVRAGTYVPGLKQLNLRFGDALHLVFELGGILLLALSAWRTRYRLVRHQSSSISSA
jgi:hypothetical protein